MASGRSENQGTLKCVLNKMVKDRIKKLNKNFMWYAFETSTAKGMRNDRHRTRIER